MPAAVPLATYRIQLTKDFTFDDAATLVPYLRELGITHLYASPFLKARPGSTHGYDIVDHDRLNPELGGDDGFARLSAALKSNSVDLILDFVPNHMGVGQSDNNWWLDVLEWGQRSAYANAFDIDWEALPYRRLPGVLLPILGRPYGDALQSGEIALRFDAEAGSFAAWHFDHKLPINPQRYGEIIRALVTAAHAESEPAGQQLIALAREHRNPHTPSYRDAAALKQRLAAIDGASAIIERGLPAYRPDSEAGATSLHRLLERQNYRLAYWRVAFAAVNYRRFFDINDLAGLRVEQPAVFRGIHPLVQRLIREDKLQGLRLDHIDGLRDPAQYAKRLRRMIQKARGDSQRSGPFYVVVEKILADGEDMPRFTGVAGTTGYEWLNVISRVLVDGKGIEALERTWRAFTGEQTSFPAMLDTAKRRVIDTMLASEFTVLSRALARIAAGHFSTRDFTLNRLREALQLYVLAFPVYRTYVTAGGASQADRATIDAAIADARGRWAGPDPEIFDFLRDTVTLDLAGRDGYSAARVRNFALKLQQFTGPLMAKAMEDTAFYRDHRLLALNEVGGHPDAHALELAEFHAQLGARATDWPDSLTATATHDTKRGEDARARILALSEIPDDWQAAVADWRSRNTALFQHVNGKRRPSKAHEYMLYQALIGVWPGAPGVDLVERVQAYALKAAREGKQETSWTNPDELYEKALNDYVAALLDPSVSAGFLGSIEKFSARTSLLGALNGLSQLALKVLMPGVPDFFQGTEFWDLSLVDPDNRRPVDFDARRQALTENRHDWASLADNWRDGRIKLSLMRRLLAIRQEFADLFARGDYEPVAVTGPQAAHVIAFARSWKGDRLVIAIGRHFATLTEGGMRWPSAIDAKIDFAAEAQYIDLLGNTGTASLCRHIPVSILRKA
ncbi:MAG: malto-oligosyltrehalose synthase [Pseudolabrys sp.]|nr:malto-oligosyltrehalose synthase [Pseudolabrys sp.]MDP2296925.1 malto-oligosyltrehalose synthase [Pseudolabrys sp.]